MNIRKASKMKTFLRIGLSGISGSGKTYSALVLALNLSENGKVCIIDTENGSGELYTHLGEYYTIPITPPYTVEKYCEAIDLAEKNGMDVIILDSLTHAWSGEGGVLEFVDSISKGNSFTGWAQGTPKCNMLTNKWLNAKAHVICTFREKTEHAMQPHPTTGKMQVLKMGTKIEYRAGIEHEFTTFFKMVNMHAVCEKDRCGLFTNREPFIIQDTTGIAIREWYKLDNDKESLIREIQETAPAEKMEMLIKDNYTEYSITKLRAVITKLQQTKNT